MAHATTHVRDVLAGAIRRQGSVLLDHWKRAAAADAAAVHRVRVASRRLREALAMALAAGAGDDARRARREGRRVTRALGPVRELDVALAELDTAARRRGWPDVTAAEARRALEFARAARRREMRRRVAGVRRAVLRSRVDRAAAAIADRLPAELRRALADHLVRRADRVLAEAAHCGTLYAVDRLHALRIAAKKLRYTVEIVEPLVGAPAAPMVTRLRAAQQLLGRLHDGHVLMAAVETALGPEGRAAAAPMLDDLERDSRERHAEIVRDLPALIADVEQLKRDAAISLRSGRRVMARAGAAVANRSAAPAAHRTAAASRRAGARPA